MSKPFDASLSTLIDELSGTLPVASSRRRSAFERYRQKLREPAFPDTVVPTLLTTSFTLCGLRHDANIIRELYMSLSRVLEDSTTYQWIIKQGFAKG
jgi:hypothetical protein